MTFDWTIWFHGAYVAFAFAVLFFGALAYRQVLDDLDVRRMQMGEDRTSFLSPPGLMAVSGALAATIAFGWLLYASHEPTVYHYALPLIIGVQNLQMAGRVLMQRTLVKTRGVVVRPYLRTGVRAFPFDTIISVSFRDERLWTTVTILDAAAGPATFRIFTFSADRLDRIFRANTTAEVFRSVRSSHRTTTPPPHIP
jgi:hypothetical protein